MMTPDPQPLAIIRPALAQQAVQNLLPVLQAELPWLTHLYGLVQTVVEKKQPLPMLYRQDGTLYQKALLPNEQMMSAMCFFERNGPSTVVWDQGTMQAAGNWRHPVNAIVWLNLPRIDRRGYDFSDELAADFLRVLREAGIAFDTVDTRMEQVFSRYRLESQKLLLYPFAGFKVPLVLTMPYDLCLKPFSQQDDTVEYLINAQVEEFLKI